MERGRYAIWRKIMEKLKVQISNRQKQVKIPSGTRLLLRRCCHAVLAYEKFEKPAEVSISFIDNREIKHLNAEFRGKDIETDVLSFPLGENGIFDKNEDTGAYMLGDIVISVDPSSIATIKSVAAISYFSFLVQII